MWSFIIFVIVVIEVTILHHQPASQLICISDIYLLYKQTNIKDIAGQSANGDHDPGQDPVWVDTVGWDDHPYHHHPYHHHCNALSASSISSSLLSIRIQFGWTLWAGTMQKLETIKLFERFSHLLTSACHDDDDDEHLKCA